MPKGLFCKNQFFSNIFRFLSVIRQKFEDNLRILANFHVITQKSMDFTFVFPKKLVFLDFLIKIILFTLKFYFFTTKDAQTFEKISFLVTILHF